MVPKLEPICVRFLPGKPNNLASYREALANVPHPCIIILQEFVKMQNIQMIKFSFFIHRKMTRKQKS